VRREGKDWKTKGVVPWNDMSVLREGGGGGAGGGGNANFD